MATYGCFRDFLRGDYEAAVQAGEEALTTREQLTPQSGIFTSYKNFPETGPAFWPGEVELLRGLAKLEPKRVRKSPLYW